MSLKVWLPLNGDLKNQGLSTSVLVNSGATVNTQGKIGSCYSFASGNYIGIDANNVNNHKYSPISCALWVYPTQSDSTERYILGCWESGGVGFVLQNQKIGWLIYVGGYKYTWTPSTITLNVWHHICGTYDGVNSHLYLDGALVATTAVSGTITYNSTCPWELGGNPGPTSFASGNFVGRMNDVRIYDHCLSPLEIKELSQGLILHYPLNNGGFGQENLVLNTQPFTPISAGQSTLTTNTYCGTIIRTYNQTLSSSYKEIVAYTNVLYPELGASYTASFWARGSGILTTYFYGASGYLQVAQVINSQGYSGTATDGSNTITLSSDWKRYWVTWTLKTSGDTTVYKHLLFRHVYTAANATLQIDLAGVKLEKGSVATSWSPAPTDALATAIGFNSNQIIDCSGYGNNGSIINSSMTCPTDTARYNVSTQFNGTTDGILIQNLNIGNIINTAVTYSFWIKPDSETGARSVYFGSYSGTSWSIEKTTGNILRSYWNGSPDETCTGATIADGVWQHVCFVKNGTNDIKVYVNGVQKWASTATHNNLTFPTTFRIGRDSRSNDGTPYKGLMSDFRIYATALSEDDIKTLYNTSMSIDNLGQSHVFEQQEDSTISVTKSGIHSQNLMYETITLSDGSLWVPIMYHNNNGGTNLFSSSDNFTTLVYHNEKCWANFPQINKVSRPDSTRYEFLTIQRANLDETFKSFRWTQTNNPIETTSVAGFTAITTGVTNTAGNGICKCSGNTYFAQTGTTSNWWKACGCWTAFQGGIPADGSIAVKQDYILYIRVSSNPYEEFKNGISLSNEFIEK